MLLIVVDVSDVVVFDVVVEWIEYEFGLFDVWVNNVMVIVFVLFDVILLEDYVCVMVVIYFGCVYGMCVVFVWMVLCNCGMIV